ncbi:ABC transporter permease [Natronoflexus pectinivorans]|uniref:ABC-2 type transport system permease protein n=1 Tax=Natronoflexus pectinivorans TaxID=682526 RepID=A0A4R2GQU7_9BACT|nr:ABC transporter permease [Natronoflexus pectinivorans]TCO10486.1 ABC-2 type transport system permease protein [Natronoflexus pectinivorans]
MNKTILILQREYLTRVRKKSFIIMTILGPLLFAAMFVIPGWIASIEDRDERQIAIIDYTGLYEGRIDDTERLKFEYLPVNKESELRSNFSTSGYYAFLLIEDDLLKKSDAIRLFSDGQITMDVRDHITRNLREFLRNEKLRTYEMDGLHEIIAEVNDVRVNISTLKLGEDGTEKHTSTEIAMIVSIFFAFLTYLFVFIYGTQVLRGVMEEKSNRIVEVIISSVKPFQLMLGKIGGIALVALTQFLLWVALTAIILFGVKALFFSDSPMPSRMDGIEMTSTEHPVGAEMENIESAFAFDQIMESINTINPVNTLLLFLFYFIGGYLLYAALFAAIGAAIDNETDSQQFMLPITIPIIIALWVAMAGFRNPHSDLVFWFSMIPLTSPIVMMSRVPFDVPGWEIALSMVLLVAGFLFATWFAARIYRTGILMYGKKVDYKELWKWFKYSTK